METREDARRLHEAMSADHLRLEHMFQDLIDTMHAGPPDDVRTAWLAFEAALLRHLELEEQHIIPAFAVGFPQEATQLLRDHQVIREGLTRFVSDLASHALREETADLFFRQLRKHAAREDTFFYVWAEAHVPDAQRKTFVDRFREWFAGERRAGRAAPGCTEQVTRPSEQAQRPGSILDTARHT